MTKDFEIAARIPDEWKDRIDSILDYMTLRIRGAGRGLSDDEIQWLNGLPEETWDAIACAIVELGGLPPGDSIAPVNPSEETLSLSRTTRHLDARTRAKDKTSG